MRHRDPQSSFGLIVLYSCIAAFIAVVVLFGFIFQSAHVAQPTVDPSAASVDQSQPATENVPGALAIINEYRASVDLPALRLKDKLEHSAQAKADDLVAMDYWAHARQGKTPWDFFSDAGYSYQRAGENLAKCWASINDVVDAWIASPTHHAVLVGGYQDVGFGISYNPKDHCNYVVAHFGTEVQTPAELPATGVRS